MSRLEELKGQLTQLDDLVRSGVLTGDAARQARDTLEAQVLAAVLPAASRLGVVATTAPADAALPALADASPSRRLLLGLVVFVLAFGAAGYAWLGNPAALAVAPGQAATVAAAGAATAASGAAEQAPDRAQFEAMTARLAERLKAKPDDAEGWSMLGRSYSVLDQFPQALEAFKQVIILRPQDAQGYADMADALGMASGRKLGPESEKLLAKALQLDPDNVKALALLGTMALDQGDAAGAAKQWEHALRKTEPGSEMASRLRGGIDEARQRAGLPALPAAAVIAAVAPVASAATSAATAASKSAPNSTQASTSSGTVQVRISLAPALAAKAAPDDTLFIFARAVQGQGPKAPLAIQRRQVKDLPLTVTLDDSMAMSPALRLSGVSQVVVGARISKSGNAMPQPGDLQGLTPTVAVGASGLQLQISDILP